MARLRTLAPTVGAVVCICVGGCGGARTTSAVSTVAQPPATSSTTAPAVATPRPRHRHRHHGPSPGSLPQTEQLPSSQTTAFHAEMRALWLAIRGDNLRRGLQAFFPQGAYVQVKTLGDPVGDFQNRLVGDYRLDIAVAHALLGSRPAAAHLVDVQVPAGYAHWVPPGVCDNRVGYYEVPNSRVVYRLAGQERSFGIASMISWRGVWYVVHLGAVVRGSGAGVVDAPSVGAGVSAPSSTC